MTLRFTSSAPENALDRGGKVEGADLESNQDSGDDSTDDEEGTERQVTSSRIKERVATEIIKDKNRQRKYHTKNRPNAVKEAGPKAARRRTASSSRWLARDGFRRGIGPFYSWTHLWLRSNQE